MAQRTDPKAAATGGTVRRERSRRGLSTRDAIRRAAVQVFHERGYAAATVRDIAGRLGIQGGSMYNHYQSKQELLLDIMSETNRELLRGLEEAISEIQDPKEKLRVAIEFHVLFHREHPMEAFLADSELRSLEPKNYRRIVAQRKDYERAIQGILEEGRAKGTFAPCHRGVVSYAIITACSAVADWFKPEGPLSIEEIAKIYSDFLVRGLAPGTASSSSKRGPKERT